MINIRDITNELLSLPRPTRRRIEVIIKLTYLKGREDADKLYKRRIRIMENKIKYLEDNRLKS